MSIRDPSWLLVIAIILAACGYFSLVTWEVSVAAFVIYVLVVGIWIELEDVRIKGEIKTLIVPKIENIEKNLSNTLQIVDSEEKIKQRLRERKKEIIAWLSKF